MKTLTELNLLWQTEDATRLLAARLAVQLSALPAQASVLIELHGDLGAGKTTLVRHLLHALGVTGRIKSPTYAIVESYDNVGINAQLKTVTADPENSKTLSIWHFDFYRFNDPHEWEEAGFRDIFASAGIKLVEWPKKAANQLPVADIAIQIIANKDEFRNVTLTTNTAQGQHILANLNDDAQHE